MSTSPWNIRCPACAAEYEIPQSFCEQLAGKALVCDGCAQNWVPFPAVGLLARMASATPEVVPIDLSAYRKGGGGMLAAPGSALSAPAPLPASPPPVRTTARVAPSVPAGAAPMLRVTAEGPDVDTRAVFDLGPRSFLIGRSGCHLNLPSAELPARAIRVRVAKSGFAFEGIGGFAVPIGGITVPSGQIDGSAPVALPLGPYRVVLEVSATPGSPIADLELAAPPRPTGPSADLRAQIPAPAPSPRGAVTPPAAASETIRDMMAQGHAAQSFRDPLQGLLVGFVGTEGTFKDKSFRITKASLIIGRTSGEMLIPDSRVSSKHAQFDVLGFDQYSLKDLASTNGTTINGRPISTTMLKNGDVVSFGGVPFRFVVKSSK